MVGLAEEAATVRASRRDGSIWAGESQADQETERSVRCLLVAECEAFGSSQSVLRFRWPRLLPASLIRCG